MADETFGASNTSKEVLAAYGALAGTAEGGKQAAALARQMYPDPEKADPWMATYEFFNAALQRASEPGQTTFGTFTGAVPAVMDYYTAKDKELAETKRARLEAGFKLAPALKPGAGKITYRPATKEELVQYGATAGQMGSDNRFYDLSKTTNTANDLKPFGLIDPKKLEQIKRVVPSAAVDGSGNVLLTDAEAAMAGVRPYIGQKVTPAKGGAEAAKYADDGTGVLRYTENPPEGKNIGDEVFEGIDLSGYTENQIKLGDQLRDDLTRALGDFNDINSSMKDINSFYTLATTTANPISDYSLAVQYAKIIDPGTAAREGEVAAIASAGSLTGAARAQIMNAILGNGKLSPKMRASIFNNSVKIYDSKLPGALGKIQRYKAVANKQKEGLFSLVGLNVDVDDAGNISYRGVGGDPAVDINNYHLIDLGSISEDPLDENPTTIPFPEDFSFEGFNASALRNMLALPPGALDAATLNKIEDALDALETN